MPHFNFIQTYCDRKIHGPPRHERHFRITKKQKKRKKKKKRKRNWSWLLNKTNKNIVTQFHFHLNERKKKQFCGNIPCYFNLICSSLRTAPVKTNPQRHTRTHSHAHTSCMFALFTSCSTHTRLQIKHTRHPKRLRLTSLNRKYFPCRFIFLFFFPGKPEINHGQVECPFFFFLLQKYQ